MQVDAPRIPERSVNEVQHAPVREQGTIFFQRNHDRKIAFEGSGIKLKWYSVLPLLTTDSHCDWLGTRHQIPQQFLSLLNALKWALRGLGVGLDSLQVHSMIGGDRRNGSSPLGFHDDKRIIDDDDSIVLRATFFHPNMLVNSVVAK